MIERILRATATTTAVRIVRHPAVRIVAKNSTIMIQRAPCSVNAARLSPFPLPSVPTFLSCQQSWRREDLGPRANPVQSSPVEALHPAHGYRGTYWLQLQLVQPQQQPLQMAPSSNVPPESPKDPFRYPMVLCVSLRDQMVPKALVAAPNPFQRALLCQANGKTVL